MTTGMRFLVPALLFTAFIFFSFFFPDQPQKVNNIDEATPIWDALHAFGEPYPDHKPASMDKEVITKGYELIFKGVTTGPDGKETPRQSKFFVCTDCHNTQREDPDLRKSDPEARLDYVTERKLRFLQGTTFWGIVNRETFYNDDYIQKYGDLVTKAQHDIRESIQVCSEHCSQGRTLEEWEIDAIVAWYWTAQMKMGDLDLSEKEWEMIHGASEGKNPEMVKLIKSKYLQKSPAHFTEPPTDLAAGYGLKGDAKRGEKLYKATCLSCHGPNGASQEFRLDETKYSKKYFSKQMTKADHENLYYITRQGTHPEEGHRAYMPHYPLERMSNQQVEDLRAYFEES